MPSNSKFAHWVLAVGMGGIILLSGSCGTGLTTLKDERRFLLVLSDNFSLATFEYHERDHSLELKTHWGLPDSPKTLAVSPDQQILLIGSTTSMSYYRIENDRHDVGEIRWQSDLPNLTYPVAQIVFHPEKNIAYVIESNGSGSLIRAVEIIEGSLVPLGSVTSPVGQFLSAIVDEEGSWVYTAYSGDSGLYRIPINSAGGVSGTPTAYFTFSSAFDPVEMKLAADGVMVSVKKGSTPGIGWTHRLGGNDESSVSVDDFPTSLAVHPDGDYAYVASSGMPGYGSSLSVYSLDSGTFEEEKQSFDMGDVAISTDRNRVVIDVVGKNAFFSHCTRNALSWFTVNDDGGELEMARSDFGAPDLSCPIALATANVTPD